jgi:hypothetical protein
MKCGKAGLTLKDMERECDNPSRMTQDEALIAAIWDEDHVPLNQAALAHAETLACDRYAKLTGDVMPFAMREAFKAALTVYLRLMSGVRG